MITDRELKQYLRRRHSFREQQIVLPSGKLYGSVEEPWQYNNVWKPLDLRNSDGSPVYKICYLECSRGEAKSTMGAMEALTSALLNEQLECHIFASDKEQAQISLTILKGLINRNPSLKSSFKINAGEITVPYSGSFIRVQASDALSSYGLGGIGKSVLFILDELWTWTTANHDELFQSIISSTGKVAGHYRILILSNAGISNESKIAWRVRESCRQDSDKYFWSSPGCIAGWISEEWKSQQKSLLTDGAYKRLIENQWTASETSFITKADLEPLIHDSIHRLPDVRSPIHIGVDASVRRDSTALAAVSRNRDGAIQLIAHHIWIPEQGRDINLSETVEPMIMALKRRYRIASVSFDPYQMISTGQSLSRKGVRITEVAQTPNNQTACTSSLMDAIKTKSLQLYQCDDLIDHLLNAALIETSRGVRLDKQKSSKKIDGAVALSLAVHSVSDVPVNPRFALIDLPSESNSLKRSINFVKPEIVREPVWYLKNVSEHPHIYENKEIKVIYNWMPGQTKGCPKSVAELMLEHHPMKFLRVREPELVDVV